MQNTQLRQPCGYRLTSSLRLYKQQTCSWMSLRCNRRLIPSRVRGVPSHLEGKPDVNQNLSSGIWTIFSIENNVAFTPQNGRWFVTSLVSLKIGRRLSCFSCHDGKAATFVSLGPALQPLPSPQRHVRQCPLPSVAFECQPFPSVLRPSMDQRSHYSPDNEDSSPKTVQSGARKEHKSEREYVPHRTDICGC